MHLITNPSDIYYLTGVRFHDPGEIFVIMNNEKGIMNNKTIILCDMRTSGLFDGSCFTIIDDRKHWENTFSKFKTLSTDPDFLTQSLREKIEKYGVKLTMKKSPITQKRIIKTPHEIELLRESQKLNKKVYEMILPFLIPGVTEEALARKIQILQLELGATGPSFPPIVAFGENSAVPHHSPTERKLHAKDIVLLDMGLVYQGYCSDMTRTFLFSGTFGDKSTQNHREQINSLSSSARKNLDSGRSDSICSRTLESDNSSDGGLSDNDSLESQKIINLLISVTNSIISSVKPGVKVADLDKKARKMLGKYAKYFTHSLGHGVGIDIHEAPGVSSKSEVILQKGMVITIEPGVYIAGKYGARYEEMCLVSEKGLLLL